MSILDSTKVDAFAGGASFTRRHRLYRVIWNITWLILAAWTPPPLRAWRRILLRAFGAQVASTANIYGSARIWAPKTFEIGEYACLGPRAYAYSMAKIKIEPYAIVSQGAFLCTGTHDIEHQHFQLRALPIVVGTRAWIAADAFVGPGVTVGEGAVLGARGCAFRDLDSWMVYGGNPARALKSRNIRFK